MAADKAWLRHARGKVVKIISFLAEEPAADNNYQVLLMHRNPAEIVACRTRCSSGAGRANATSDERAVQPSMDAGGGTPGSSLRRSQIRRLELRLRRYAAGRGAAGAAQSRDS